MATTSCSIKEFYFLRITPTNYLYAWWLSRRHSVAAWKIELPNRLARSFEVLRPNDVFALDEWLLVHDRIFDQWKEKAFPIVSNIRDCAASYSGISVDFSRNLWQVIGIDFERLAILKRRCKIIIKSFTLFISKLSLIIN